MDLPHHPAGRRVRQRHLGGRLLALHRERRRVGPDDHRPGARGWSTCRSRCRPTTTTAGTGWATTSSRTASSRSTSRRASDAGTSRSRTTTSGTGTCRPGPCLADITVDGRDIKAVALPTKQSWLFVFDRETGEPVWPIEEQPVAASDIPGERLAPTQPHPTKPPAFDQQGIGPDDLVDFTPGDQGPAPSRCSGASATGAPSTRRRRSARPTGRTAPCRCRPRPGASTGRAARSTPRPASSTSTRSRR